MIEAGEQQPSERTPSTVLGDLFAQVAMMNVMPAKDWADATPKASPDEIRAAFAAKRPDTSNAIMTFVHEWFELPVSVAATSKGGTLEAHIEATWPALARHPFATQASDSLLPLPEPWLAPGGRFRECYYWDSFFTLIGLRHRPELIRASAENFRWQIEQYGFVPNANRTYYLGRSQPPFFFKVVELLSEVEGAHAIKEFLPALMAEHRFWMDGEERLHGPGAFRRVVRLPDGTLLNRFWDDVPLPRDESYRWDVMTAQAAKGRLRADVYRDIRAACESGWDFSSRWLGAPGDFSSIMTTSIAPSDLNSILYGLECFIAAALAAQGDKVGADRFSTFASKRREAMHRLLWNERLGGFDDYDWKAGRQRGIASAAAAAPLLFGLATEEQARSTASLIETQLLAPGGVLTTTRLSDLQWDSPNGWAPLQWIAAEGLARYGFDVLAAEIRRRWLVTVASVFQSTGRMLEKYDIVRLQPGGGGEYVLQDGFGWTNGVTKVFLEAGGKSWTPEA